MIYHITGAEEREKAVLSGFYEAPSLLIEGFIHACTLAQIPGVLKRYYAGKHNLLLLHIAEEKLQSPFKFELSPSTNEMFPHIYGRVNADAVIKIETLPPPHP